MEKNRGTITPMCGLLSSQNYKPLKIKTMENYANNAVSSDVVRDPSQFDQIESRIDSVRERVSNVTVIIERCTNALDGSEPSAGADVNMDKEAPSTILNRIGAALNYLEANVTSLEHESDRLQKLF